MLNAWRNSSPFLSSSPFRAGDLFFPSLQRAMQQLSLRSALARGLGKLWWSWGVGVGREAECTEWGEEIPPSAFLNLQFGLVLVSPSWSAIFQAGVGRRRVLEKGPRIGPWIVLAQRFQLHMSGPAYTAGLASLLGQGAERPKPGSSEKSQGLNLLLGWPLGSCGLFSVDSKKHSALPTAPVVCFSPLCITGWGE